MIVYSRVTEVPDSEPVALAVAKQYLSVTLDDDDALIRTLLKSARRMAEAYTGLSLVTQERTIKLDSFPANSPSNPYGAIILPYGPIQSVTEFTYIDSEGDEQTLTVDEDFTLDDHSQPARVFAIDTDGSLAYWPSTQNRPNAVTIVYQAGFDDVSGQAIPDEVRSAILRQTKEMYDKREDDKQGVVPFGGSTTDLCLTSKRMLDNIKVYWNANL